MWDRLSFASFRLLYADNRNCCLLYTSVGLSGLLPREDDSLKGERNLEAMMNRQEKKLRRKRVLQIVRYTTSAAAMIALTWMLAWYMFVGSETPSYTEITVPKGQRVRCV